MSEVAGPKENQSLRPGPSGLPGTIRGSHRHVNTSPRFSALLSWAIEQDLAEVNRRLGEPGATARVAALVRTFLDLEARP